ncbi:MAG: hypothetical protein ACI9G9_001652, partial [Psychromonas sp.]
SFVVYDELTGMKVKMPSRNMKISPSNKFIKEIKEKKIDFELN